MNRLEGSSIVAQSFKKPKKKSNKDMTANMGSKILRTGGSVELEEMDVEVTLDSEGIEVNAAFLCAQSILGGR